MTSDSTQPFKEATEKDLTDEKVNALVDKLIKGELSSIKALAFCMEKMILCGDISTEYMKSYLDLSFPGLVDDTQRYLKIIHNGPAYDAYTKEEKDTKLDCDWPKKIPAVLLMKYDVSNTDIPVLSFAQAVGNDMATGQYFEDLSRASIILHQSLLNTYGYGEDELPIQRIIDVVNYAEREGDTAEGIPFKIWIAETLLDVPHMLFNHLEATG